MARKCTEYHYFKHTYWDAMAQYNWTRCPHCAYVRFFMPYETLSEDETRKFRDLQEH